MQTPIETKPKILVTTSSFDLETPEMAALAHAGYGVILNPHGRRLSESEVSALLTPDIVGMIAGVEPLTRTVLEKATGLKIVSRCGAGLDSVDLFAAQERGIAVFNTPDAPAAAVAELTVGLMLDVLRGISLQDRALRRSDWVRPMGGLLGTCTVGIVGYGHIGARVTNHVQAFGARVLACDPQAAEKSVGRAEFVSFDHLLEASDIVTIHIPFTPQTRHLFDATTLGKMKAGAILINTARGELVDEDALAQAIASGHLSGAALDVYETEPYTGALTMLDAVVLTAHTGSYARETRILQEAEAARNLLQGLGIPVARRKRHETV